MRKIRLCEIPTAPVMTALFAVFSGLLIPAPAQALTITNVAFTPSAITTETTGLTTGTSIGFTIDTPGEVQIGIVGGIQNFGDAGVPVATLTQFYAAPGPQTIFWNALWPVEGTVNPGGRIDGSYQFTLTLSTGAGTFTTATPPSPQVTINSIDIHGLTVIPSLDSGGNPTFPYVVRYALAKSAAVTVSVQNSSGTLVRTVIANKIQFGESVSTATVSWDGLDTNLKTVPIGIYTVLVNATDPSNNDPAITRSQQIAVASLAGASTDPQKLFEQNVFVYPNPVRNGQGIFQYEAIRDGATISIKIYTLTGDLVLDQSFAAPIGNIQTFTWNASNQSGHKVGRGLYYYVVREEDAVGTLQTIKKMAVLP